jgi:hypothetical protein
MASFSPLVAGKPRIPERAPVKSGLRPSSERTRSFSEALLYRHSELGITKFLICERSELEKDEKKLIYEQSELRVKSTSLKKFYFLENRPQEKLVLRVLYLVLISFRKLSAAEN